MRLYERLVNRHSVLGASFNGSQLYTVQESFKNGEERLPHDFVEYVQEGYAANGVVFACILARSLLLSEIEFKFQRLKDRELYGSPALKLLENPWPNGSTGEMVARAEQDVSLAGNFYVRKVGNRLERMRPDWVSIVSGIDANGVRHLAGYVYTEGGTASGNPGVALDVREVGHWSPIPDPLAPFRGMSWLTPVAREIVGDKAMSRHKNRFFNNAATPNMIVSTREKLEPEQREQFISAFRARHEGVDNAYKTVLIDGGADISVVGNSFEQMSFGTVQAAGENRIAVASGVPSIVVGLKEGLQASTYSNYNQAMRRFADMTIRPMWRSLAKSLEGLVDTPGDSRLWYDDGHIAALQQDAKDGAEIQQVQAASIRTLTDAGYTPESAIAAVTSGDMKQLQHTGVFSVQLQPPMTETPTEPERADNFDGVADAIAHSDELAAARAEVERTARKRSLRVIRNESGQVTSVEEA